jgi:hypothetical protein
VRAAVAISYTCPDELVSGVKKVLKVAFKLLKKTYSTFELFHSTENSVIRGQMLELLRGNEMQMKLAECGCSRLDGTQLTSELWKLLTYQMGMKKDQPSLPCLCLNPECTKKRTPNPQTPFMVSRDCLNHSLNVRQNSLGAKFDKYDDQILMVRDVSKSEGHSFTTQRTFPRARAGILGLLCGSTFGNTVLQKVIDDLEGSHLEGRSQKRNTAKPKNHKSSAIDRLWAAHGPDSDDEKSVTTLMLNGAIHQLVTFQETVEKEVAARGLNTHVCYYVSDCSRKETAPGSGQFRIVKDEQYAWIKREDSILRQQHSGETWGDKVHYGYDGFEHGKLATVVLIIPAQNGFQSRLIESYIYRYLYFNNPGSVLNQKDIGNATLLKSHPCVTVTAVLVGEGTAKGMLALNKTSRRATRRRLKENMPEGVALFVYPEHRNGSKRDSNVYDDVSDGGEETKEFEDWENNWD